jgi:fluoroquinolone resistance protein
MPREAMHAEMPDTNSSISSQAHYVDQVFKDEQLEHAEIVSAEFYDCVFFHSSFAESVFRHCRFVNCVFRECDLSLIKVPESSFTSSRFENSKVIGVNWTEVHWPKAGLGNPIGFFKCAISHSTFIGLRLRGMEIKDCVALDVDFREADLSGAHFSGTDLSGSLFGSTDLSEADLSRARNYRIDPGQNILKHARFSLPEAMSLLHSMEVVLVDEE